MMRISGITVAILIIAYIVNVLLTLLLTSFKTYVWYCMEFVSILHYLSIRLERRILFLKELKSCVNEEAIYPYMYHVDRVTQI